MGVFNNNGIVGVVSNTTKNFCEVTTIISQYSKLLTSIKTSSGFIEEGVLKWDGVNYRIATLEGVGNEIKFRLVILYLQALNLNLFITEYLLGQF